MPHASPVPHDELGPYFARRARDKVRWLPWSAETFAIAQAKKQLIYVHVGRLHHLASEHLAQLAHSDPRIASLLNEQFVSVLVDADEQAEVLTVLSSVAMLLKQTKGLPLQALLGPDGAPFFLTGYLEAHGTLEQPGLFELLSQSAQLFKEKPEEFAAQARSLSHELQQRFEPPVPTGTMSDELSRMTFLNLGKSFDASFYGFGRAPKLAQVPALSFLLAYSTHKNQAEAKRMALLSLGAMSNGGLYDQLSGGFFHQSQDREFLLPSYEKQLGDNAQLALLYLTAFQLTDHGPFRRIASEVLDFLLEQMSSPEGGFFLRLSAEDAQGSHYLWTRRQLKKALGEPAATRFAHFYDVPEQAEGVAQRPLNARRSVAEVAFDLGIADAELITSLEGARADLLEQRRKRSGVVLDDRRMTSDNALTVSALSRVGLSLDRDHYIEQAERTALRFWKQRDERGLLPRSLTSVHCGLLDDQVHFARALVDLHQATLNPNYLSQASELCHSILSAYAQPLGVGDQNLPQALLLSLAPTTGEGAAPDALSVFCTKPYPQGDTWYAHLAGTFSLTLQKLAHLKFDPQLLQQAHALLTPYSAVLRRAPHGACGLVLAVNALREPTLLVEVPNDPQRESELLHAVQRILPGRQVLVTRGEAADGEAPEPRALTNALQVTPASLDDWNENYEQWFEKASQGGQNAAFRPIHSGRASASGTRRLLTRARIAPHKRVNFHGLELCPLGLGTYRIGLDKPAHADAVRAALRSGINLIDTSPSFALGDSQRVVGDVIGELITSGELARDELVVIGKLGLAIGQDAEDLEARRVSSKPPLATVPLHASNAGGGETSGSLLHGAFSLDPDFLSAQLTRSLARLGLDHFELCLIHGPEYLFAAGYSAQALEQALSSAFVCLEKEVQAGRIGGYGLVSHKLVAQHEAGATAEAGNVAVADLLRWANAAAQGKSHFVALESPANLVEDRALSQPDGIFQFAREHGVLTLACRPLSAMTQGALLRLTEVPPSADGAQAKNRNSAQYRVASLEAEFETTWAVQLRLAQKAGSDPILPFNGPIGRALLRLSTREQFDQAETTLLTPRLRALLAQLDRAFVGQSNYAKWRDNYIQAVGVYLACLREECSEKNRALLKELEEIVLVSPWLRTLEERQQFLALSWPGRALAFLLSHSTTDIVLVGLRSAEQVHGLSSLVHEPAAENA